MLPKEGKYSSMKNPTIWRWPDKTAMPVSSKINPPNFVITDKYFLKFLEKNKNLLIKIPEIIKGTAKPRE